MLVHRYCEKCSTGVSYCKNQYETHVGHSAHTVQNDPKIDLGVFRTRLIAKVACQSCLEARRARFWRVGGVFGTCLGGLLGTLGRLSAALGRLLGVSGVPFGCSWGALGRIMPLMDAPDLDFRGFGRVPAGFWGFFGASFGHTFCMLTLVSYHALNAALNPRWHLLWLLLSYLKRGGTCAAHGIKPLGVIFRGESASDVQKIIATPKLDESNRKRVSRPKKSDDFFVSTPENEMLGIV